MRYVVLVDTNWIVNTALFVGVFAGRRSW